MTNIVSNKVGTHIQNVLALALDNAIKQKESCTFWHFLREGNLGGLIGTIGRSAQAAQLGRALKQRLFCRHDEQLIYPAKDFPRCHWPTL